MPREKLTEDRLKVHLLKHLSRLPGFVATRVSPEVMVQVLTPIFDLLIQLYGEHAYRAIDLSCQKVQARKHGYCLICFLKPALPDDDYCERCSSEAERLDQEEEKRLLLDSIDPYKLPKN
ncbi:MAG: hypothetical protein CEO12_114 [Parcubacteria group bacterium Gr01-1014_46]|nr:MAG: hypothetical protein CEO12_114 [Parcubacteria group bacterium Gr01-1014_46]